MGLLFVGGIPYHDEDQELIERAARRHRLARHVPMVNDGETFDGYFDGLDAEYAARADYERSERIWKETLAARRALMERLDREADTLSLSEEVRAAARKRAEQTEQ